MLLLLLQKTLFNPDLDVLKIWIGISHRIDADIKRETHHKLTVRDEAASIYDVVLGDLECCWIVDLLKITCKVAIVIVLPLYES